MAAIADELQWLEVTDELTMVMRQRQICNSDHR